MSVTRDNNLMTVAGSVSSPMTVLAVNGQAAAWSHDGPQRCCGSVRFGSEMHIRQMWHYEKMSLF